MGLLSSLEVEKDVTGSDTDSLGGGGFFVPSDVYNCIIDMAYVEKLKTGSMWVNLHLKTDVGKEIKVKMCIQGGEAKGSKNYSVNANGEKKLLMGFSQANALAQIVAFKPLHELADEEKAVLIYDFDARKELPTKVPVLTELLDKPIKVGITRVLEDKYKAEGFRTKNEVGKFFRAADSLTSTEIAAKATEAVFLDKWLEKNKDVDIDKRSKGNAAKTGTVGAPTVSSGATPSLFA